MTTSLQDCALDAANTRGLSVAAGGSAHTKNSTYTELIAAGATSAPSTGVLVQLKDGGTARAQYLVDIATGGAGSEAVKIENLLYSASATANGTLGQYWYFFPLQIAAGARVSATCQSTTGGANLRVSVKLMFDPMCYAVGTSVVAIGADTANTRGQVINLTLNPAVLSSWVQLMASTGTYLGFSGAFGRFDNSVGNDWQARTGGALSLALGGAGSEVPIISDWMGSTDDSVRPINAVIPYLPVPISPGQRMSAAFRCPTSSFIGGDHLSALAYGLVA